MRVVIDTNIWVSGLLWRGAPWRLLRLAERGEIELCIMYCLERPIGTIHLQKVGSAFQALSAGGLAHPGQC